MIYVTHDQMEAMTMADKIVVLKDGIIEQVGSPMQLYQHPKNIFVAGFMGSPKMNFLSAKVESSDSSGCQLAITKMAKISLPSPSADLEVGESVTVGYRPEDIILCGEGEGHQMLIDVAELLGGTTYLYGSFGSMPSFVIEAKGLQNVKSGDQVHFKFDASKVHLFSSSGAAILDRHVTIH